MNDPARQLVQALPDVARLAQAAHRLRQHLLAAEGAYPESRARALLRVADAADDPTLNDFHRLVAGEPAARLALHDLLRDSGLAADAECDGVIRAAAATAPEAEEAPAATPWLSLALAAFARSRQYPLAELDPASPPDPHSPAGRVVQAAGQFLRGQVQRAPTERERLARTLAYDPASAEASADAGPTPMVPDPSVYRPPVPVRYPEIAAETITVDVDEQAESPTVRRGEPLVITEEDVRAATPAPLRVDPPAPSPIPPGAVVMPGAETGRPGLSVSGGRRRRGATQTTRLRVVVQEHANGPGMYGIQVHVRSRSAGVKVAGTTNRDGHFLCQLPVKPNEGVTYDVEVSWPRDQGDKAEKKAITLNADRTEFTIPFYPQYRPEDPA